MIRSPWIEQILAGRKSWEIRGTNTNVRGHIALIRSGSGKIVGTCDLVDVIGPLTLSDIQDNASISGSDAAEFKSLPYQKTYAWVLKNPEPLEEPIPYKHPSGAIIWVRLPDVELSTDDPDSSTDEAHQLNLFSLESQQP
ncbi:MAG: ASCH domain-containing protein [Pyrinomonadaceae bacterium]